MDKSKEFRPPVAAKTARPKDSTEADIDLDALWGPLRMDPLGALCGKVHLLADPEKPVASPEDWNAAGGA